MSPVLVTEKVRAAKVCDSSEASADFARKQAIFRVIKVALLSALFTFMLFEARIRFIVFVGKPASSDNPQYHLKYLVAKTLSKDQDNVVLLGDSLMKAGIYSEMVTAKIQRFNPKIRVVNLAVNGGNQDDAITYLEFLKRQGVTPRLAVFDYEITNTGDNVASQSHVETSSSNCSLPAGSQDHKIDSSSSRGYLFDGLLRRPEGVLKTFEVFWADNLYVVRHRGTIKRYILDFLKAVQFPKRFERKAFAELRDWDDYGTTTNGTSPNHRLINREDREEQRKAIWPFHSTSPQSSGYRYNANFYNPIISYCKREKIPLLLLWLPHQSAIYREFYCKAPYTEDWFKSRFFDYSHDNDVHSMYLELGAESAYYTDYRHLSTYGCIRASEQFAESFSDPKFKPLIQTQSDKDSTETRTRF
jgi:hypothetical protein